MRIISALLLLLISCSSFAVTLKAKIEAGNLRWNNVITGDYMVPSTWDIVKGLTPTNKWIPGGLAMSSANTVRLTRIGGGAVNIPLEIVGFDYNVGTTGAELNTDKSETTANGYGCSDEVSLPLVRVVGKDCTTNYALTTTVAYNPYSFIRPVFKVDESKILAAFQGDVSPGTYTAMIPAQSFYYFYFSSGAKSKFYQSHSVNIEIEYVEVARITSVVVSGNRELTTTYNSDNTVSAQTQLTVEVKSDLGNDGVNMSLKGNKNSYKLTGPGMIKIPYNIVCEAGAGCTGTYLVKDGEDVLNKDSILLSNNNYNDNTRIQFKLNIFYDGVELDELDTGYYRDSFILMFEPSM